MTPPETSGPFGDELYEQVRPLAYADEDNGWPLLHFVSAFALTFELLEDVARDSDDGPGFSKLLDVERAPVWALAWLAQFPGVRLLPRRPDETLEDWAVAMRDRIQRADGKWRGGVDAMRAAAERRLIGTRYVIFNERVGGNAYVLGVRTLDAETPDPDGTLADLLEQKPAGIRLDYGSVPGQTWDALATAYDSWADVIAAYDTWDDVRANLP